MVSGRTSFEILQKAIAAQGLTQAEVAKVLRVTQPRVSDLLRGRAERAIVRAEREGDDGSVAARERRFGHLISEGEQA